MHGWPNGLRARDLIALGLLTATGGKPDSRGWPTAARMSYDWVRPSAGVAHPADAGVILGTVKTTGHDCDAVVSLCQRGTAEVPLPGNRVQDHVEVWLMDSEDPDANPNLNFMLADTAAVIAEMRAEGRRVLLHCVTAEQRTPTMAVAYAAHLGQDRAEAAA